MKLSTCFCDYDEETNSYVSLSRTAERNQHFATRSRYTSRTSLLDPGIRTGYFTVKLLRVTERGKRHGCL